MNTINKWLEKLHRFILPADLRFLIFFFAILIGLIFLGRWSK